MDRCSLPNTVLPRHPFLTRQLWLKEKISLPQGRVFIRMLMNDLSKISIVLPSLDPDEKLNLVIDGLLEYGFRDIILVNDGSKPENLHYFTDAAAAHPEIHLLHHEVNRGKGAALKTAFAWFLENRPDGFGVVTVDGDNQHHPEDTRNCARQMLKTGHLVLGCRDFSLPHVPFRSRNGNRITCGVFRLFCGLKISDTQTGLRAIPTTALPTLVNIKGDRFEYETNMLLALKEYSIPWDEVKIRTVYIEENQSSHFRVLHDSVRIYKLILAYFFRYTLSSLFSSLVDQGIFTLLSWLFHTALNGFWLTAVPTIIARICSSLLNFFINKKAVFHSHTATLKALLRYYTVAIPTMLAQMGLTYAILHLFDIQEEQILLRSVVYAIVMVTLFIIGYVAQQRWVFSSRDTNEENEHA